MNKKKYGLIAIAAVAIILIILFVSGYNSFVKLDVNVNAKWGEIQNTYQRRTDLIPNLVNIVKGSTEYEQTTLRQLAEARAKAGQVRTDGASFNSYQQLESAQGQITSQLNKTIAVVESYPDLGSTQEFKKLQGQLEGTERRIRFARKDFNEAVADYNHKARAFPWNIVGSVLGFHPKEGFSSDAGAENAPGVKFK